MAVEADLIRAGLRLRWVGDGTDRLTIRDLWALVNAFLADQTSALHRSKHPDEMPLALQLAADQANATMLVAHTMASLWSERKPGKFKPLRIYPGSPFGGPTARPMIDAAARLGGYRRMSREQATAWARRRGIHL